MSTTMTPPRPATQAATHTPPSTPASQTGTPPSKPPTPPSGPSKSILEPSPFAGSDDVIGGIPAYGTLIQVLSSGSGVTPETYATIAGVGDITGPANSMAEVDVTSHSTGAPIKQTIPGLIDLGTLSFPCFWNPEDPTQNINSPYGLEYLFFNRRTTKFQLVMPNATHRTRQFRGFVMTMGEDYKVAGVCTRNTSIRITSPMLDVPPPMSLSPTEDLAVPQAGQPSGTFTVTSGGSNAPWSAVPSDTWIHITAPIGQQQGDGEVTYTVDAGAGTARNGTITVTGLNLVFNIGQLAT